jgi:hypothetical protein
MAASDYEFIQKELKRQGLGDVSPDELGLTTQRPGVKTTVEREIKTPVVRDSSRNTTLDYLAGASPILLSFLTGNSGYGAQVAAQNIETIMANRPKPEFETTKVKSEIEPLGDGSPGKMYPRDYYDKKTNELVTLFVDRAANVYTRGGELAEKNRYVAAGTPEAGAKKKAATLEVEKEMIGKGRSFRDDPTTGLVYLVDNATGDPIRPVFRKGEFTPKTQAFVEKKVDKYNTASKKIREGVEEVKNLRDQITSSTNLGEKLAVMGLVKRIESRLSDQDRSFYTLPAGFFTQIIKKIRLANEEKLYRKVVREAGQLIGAELDRLELAKARGLDRFSSQMARHSRKELTREKARELLEPTMSPDIKGKPAPKSPEYDPTKSIDEMLGG